MLCLVVNLLPIHPSYYIEVSFEEDTETFVVVTDAKEVLGEGFMPHRK